MSETLQQTLLDYVERGGTAIIGPEIPYLDSDMRTRSMITDATLLEVKKYISRLKGFSNIDLLMRRKLVKSKNRLQRYRKKTFMNLLPIG